MSNIQDFSGLWIPVITPFRDGAVDHAALARLVKEFKAAGIAGVVACGSTGEATALEPDEQIATLQTCLDAAEGLPVVMGISGYNLASMLESVRRLNRMPLNGLLVPAPCYIRPSQAGILAWFEAIANASEHPLIVYDIPYRTGSTIELDSLLCLSEHPRIRAVKDCGGDARKTRQLLASRTLQVLAGEDASMFDSLAQGGAGAIAASAHLATSKFVELVRLLRAGELERARMLWRTLLPLIEAVFAEPNPAPVKAMLAAQGRIREELRAPMMPATAAFAGRLKELAPALSLP